MREPGFAANVELLLKLYAAGARFAEVPTTNDWSTRKGSSKMRLRPTATAYFRVMLPTSPGASSRRRSLRWPTPKRAAARRALPPGPLEAARPRALEAPAQAVPAASDR